MSILGDGVFVIYFDGTAVLAGDMLRFSSRGPSIRT